MNIMKLKVCLVIYMLALNVKSSLSLDAICSYEHYKWLVVGQIYFCKVLNRLNIISPEHAVIRDAEGTHIAGKINDDILGFYALNKSIEFFPRGIEKIFKNLKLINIQHGRIKEIHQADLKPHTKLEYLALWENDIEVLEDGLFDFNPDLAYVYFEKNKIFEIHPKVFDNLNKLAFLDLQTNLCIDMYAKNNPAALIEVIKETKTQCTSLPIKNLFNQVKVVDKKSTVAVTKAVNFEFGLKICQNSVVALNQKIVNVENAVKMLILARNAQKPQELENSNGKILLIEQEMKNLELTMAVAKVENSANVKTLSDRTINLEEKLEKLQNELKAFNIEALQAKVENIEKSIKAQEFENLKKYENLEKALKNNEDILKSFKIEIFEAVEKIMEKLKENSEKFEQKSSEKFNELSANFKTDQDRVLGILNEKIQNFESGLSNLQTKMLDSIKNVHESCDVE